MRTSIQISNVESEHFENIWEIRTTSLDDHPLTRISNVSDLMMKDDPARLIAFLWLEAEKLWHWKMERTDA